MRPTPQLSFKTWGGGAVGGGVPAGGGGGGVPTGGRGGGGVPAGGRGGIGPGVRVASSQGWRGGGVRVRLRSPSWWNQSWFYNPF